MTLIVKTVTRLTVGLILLFALYITLRGCMAYGGGFTGGVMIALSFIHIVLAYGKKETLKLFSMKSAFAVMSGSALIFMMLGASGFFKGGIFANYMEKSGGGAILCGGLMPIYNILVALLVGSALFAVFVALVSYKKEDKK